MTHGTKHTLRTCFSKNAFESSEIFEFSFNLCKNCPSILCFPCTFSSVILVLCFMCYIGKKSSEINPYLWLLFETCLFWQRIFTLFRYSRDIDKYSFFYLKFIEISIYKFRLNSHLHFNTHFHLHLCLN